MSAMVWAICTASSRVGLRITARTPGRRGSVERIWIRGSANASVLPVPVWAVATRSRPAMAGSNVMLWIGVGSVKPFRARFFLSTSERGNSENFIIQLFEKGISQIGLPVKEGRDADQLQTSV